MRVLFSKLQRPVSTPYTLPPWLGLRLVLPGHALVVVGLDGRGGGNKPLAWGRQNSPTDKLPRVCAVRGDP